MDLGYLDLFSSYKKSVDVIRRTAKSTCLALDVDKECDDAINKLNELKEKFNLSVNDPETTINSISMREYHNKCIDILNNLQNKLGYGENKRIFNFTSPYKDDQER